MSALWLQAQHVPADTPVPQAQQKPSAGKTSFKGCIYTEDFLNRLNFDQATMGVQFLPAAATVNLVFLKRLNL